MASPTNWIIADDDMVSCEHRVRLDDGREGVIVRVARDRHGRLDWRGWPEVNIDGQPVTVCPARIASRVE